MDQNKNIRSFITMQRWWTLWMESMDNWLEVYKIITTTTTAAFAFDMEVLHKPPFVLGCHYCGWCAFVFFSVQINWKLYAWVGMCSAARCLPEHSQTNWTPKLQRISIYYLKCARVCTLRVDLKKTLTYASKRCCCFSSFTFHRHMQSVTNFIRSNFLQRLFHSLLSLCLCLYLNAAIKFKLSD